MASLIVFLIRRYTGDLSTKELDEQELLRIHKNRERQHIWPCSPPIRPRATPVTPNAWEEMFRRLDRERITLRGWEDGIVDLLRTTTSRYRPMAALLSWHLLSGVERPYSPDLCILDVPVDADRGQRAGSGLVRHLKLHG